MFRNSPVHHQERFVQSVFADFDMWQICKYSLQNADDDGPVRSETCRANLSAE